MPAPHLSLLPSHFSHFKMENPLCILNPLDIVLLFFPSWPRFPRNRILTFYNSSFPMYVNPEHHGFLPSSLLLMTSSNRLNQVTLVISLHWLSKVFFLIRSSLPPYLDQIAQISSFMPSTIKRIIKCLLNKWSNEISK